MGFRYAKGPEITEYLMETDKLPAGETHVFACFSDLHECSFGNENELLLSAIDSIKPEAVLIPGDLVSASVNGESQSTMLFLRKLHKKYERIYFSPGNHERKIFEKIRLTRQMMLFKKGLLKSGVDLMRNTYEDFSDKIRVYSLDLQHDFYRRLITRRVPLKVLGMLLGKNDQNKFNILLAHDPDHFPDYVKWSPDLILSGHVHGGIIRLPKVGGLVSPSYTPFPKYDSGVYEKDGVKMIVSRGAGEHTVNLRFNNPPEILKIIIKGRS